MPASYEFAAFKLAMLWLAEGITSIPIFLTNCKKKEEIEITTAKSSESQERG